MKNLNIAGELEMVSPFAFQRVFFVLDPKSHEFIVWPTQGNIMGG